MNFVTLVLYHVAIALARRMTPPPGGAPSVDLNGRPLPVLPCHDCIPPPLLYSYLVQRTFRQNGVKYAGSHASTVPRLSYASSADGLSKFIADIRGARVRDLEEKRINKEMANIRKKFKGTCRITRAM